MCGEKVEIEVDSVERWRMDGGKAMKRYFFSRRRTEFSVLMREV
jgi:hypothetical protein